MSERYLVVFPRGFIGVTNMGLNSEKNKKTAADRLIDMRYKKENSEEDKTEVYNLNVTKLYSLMIDSLASDKLTFNKAVIIEALRCFGNIDFAEWIKIQKNSRYFTLNHQKFVLDTLKFILTGKRNVSIRSWEVLLHRKFIDDIESVRNNPDFDKVVDQFFKTFASDGQPLSSNLTRIIPQWLSNRGGNEDLLLTLNIVFGKELNN